MKTALIIGGGFAGCTAANMLKEKGFTVTVIEKTDVLGGGCRTFFYCGHPYTYGPHHFLVDTDDTCILEYMKKYLTLRELEHYCMTFVAQDSTFFTYPIHKDEIQRMPDREKIENELKNLPEIDPKNFEEYWKYSVGETLYNKFINAYSKKMWNVKNNKILDEFTFSFKNKRQSPLKTGSKKCFDGQKTVWYPVALDGYNTYFDQCVDGCEVVFNTVVDIFDLEKKRIFFQGAWKKADIIVSTVSPDILFDYHYGELPYIGRDFLKIVLPVERITPEPYCFIHYGGDEPYTRIFEYKVLTGYTSSNTLIIVETPSFNNKLYPYPVMAEINKAKRYISELPEGVYSIGRMGNYHYDNMDVVIKHCFKFFKEV
ncbi:MAG: NAD(P)-binding protein [Candidatus Brocadiaceae bacterium]|nr:NAD(P)-binding protein [Candidatus Brocadiaceae bacterium]